MLILLLEIMKCLQILIHKVKPINELGKMYNPNKSIMFSIVFLSCFQFYMKAI